MTTSNRETTKENALARIITPGGGVLHYMRFKGARRP